MANTSQNEVSELVQKLVAITATVDKDDIVLFAELHGWCERLIEGVREDASAPAGLLENAQAAAAALEELIMGTDDAQASLDTFIRSAKALGGDSGGKSPAGADSGNGNGNGNGNGAFASETFQAWRSEIEEALSSVEPNDLTGLAKMHGSCQAYAKQASPKGEAPEPTIHEYVTQIGHEFETLILGDAESPDDVLRNLREMIAAPGATASTASTASAASTEKKPDTAAESDVTQASDTQVTGEHGAEPVRENESAASPTPEPAQNVDSPAASLDAPSPAADPVSEREASFVPEPLILDPTELEFVAAFIEEASEHIEGIEVALLEVEQAPKDPDKINELFRPFHTIKGMAGFLNLRDVNSLTHEVETLLDQGRRGDRELTAGIIDIVFEVIDILKAQIAAIGAHTQNPTNEPVPQPPVSEMIDHLRDVIAGRIVPDGKSRGSKTPPVTETPATPAAVAAVGEESPPSANPDQAGTTATTGVETPAAASAAVSPATAAVSAPASAPAGKPASSSPPSTPPSAPKAAVGDQSVRIDTHKLDALVDLVGELVIAHTQVASHQSVTGDSKLNKDAGQVTKIVRDVQEVTMAMRMIPIKSTFQKMGRLVRDLSRKAGKNVELTISGEETELDKNVIQQIGDPLVHMVRNACDHGIESPEKRSAVGKPESGHVHLNAFHQSGNIVIEISDDGKGLDPQALIVKAIEKEIISPDAELTDEQAYNLIFAAGFSTAEVITDVSGRGVGMDVVRRNIEQLRGKVEITSELGKGSTFSIRLPLTLAIIDGMLVGIGQERFIIPTNQIEQALRPLPEQISTVQNRGELLQLRGQLIPLIQLGQMFQLIGRVEPTESMVVITHTERGQVGFVVDALIGQQQVVIKTLGERLMGLRGVSGAAILGDGKVGLILDASGARSAYDEWRSGILTPKATPMQESTRALQENVTPNSLSQDEQQDEQALGNSVTETQNEANCNEPALA